MTGRKPGQQSAVCGHWQAWKKCRSRDLGSDKTADFGIKFEFKKKKGEKRRRKKKKKGRKRENMSDDQL